MKCIVEMKNSKTGAIEVYHTEAENMEQIERSLALFRENGYEILSCRTE